MTTTWGIHEPGLQQERHLVRQADSLLLLVGEGRERVALEGPGVALADGGQEPGRAMADGDDEFFLGLEVANDPAQGRRAGQVLHRPVASRQEDRVVRIELVLG